MNVVRYFIVLCAVCCATVSAQIDHLVTTSDGSILYFSTALQFKGTSPMPGVEIFRYRNDAGTFEPCVPAGGLGVFGASNAAVDAAGNPDVTADGSIVAWNEFLGCTSTDFHQCLGLPALSPVGLITDSTFASQPIWHGGHSYVQLSRNGHYAAILGGTSSVLSLADGITTPIGNLIYGASETISDNGLVVVFGNPPALVSAAAPGANASLPLQFSRQPAQVRVSRDGRHILYESVQSGLTAQLFSYDVASNQETLIATGPVVQSANSGSTFPYFTFSFFACFDDNGATVLYVNSPSPGTPSQVFLWNVGDAPPGRQIANIPEGVAEAVLSGSANVAYAATLNNRLVRIDVASGLVRELSGRVPVVSSWFPGTGAGIAPGSLMQANGSGLADAVGTVSVMIGDTEAFIVSGNSNKVTFQIPWELPVRNPTCAPLPVSFGSLNNAVFDAGIYLLLCSTAPQFISAAIHQDFRGAVTQGDPASAGEILHFYMIGLGPVSPPAQTGVVATGKPLQYAQPPQCSLKGYNASSVAVTPSFAGLAPGLIGTYQLDLQLPELPSLGVVRTVGLECISQLSNASTEFYYH
jgi:uncharacterized protein (TIGR03437 family)